MNLVGAQFGKYKITKQLDAGSFGTVCLADDICLSASKAIKILPVFSPTDYLQKINEAQILDKCRHKNIICINEANVINFGGVSYLVIDIEFADGGSVESYMQSNWISAKKAVNIVNDALFGLDHAHMQGFLHRDIKPANILMAGNVIKLSDFGLAQYTTSGYGGAEGYRSHLAPECYKDGKTSFLTDIYAMGVTFFRIINNMNDWTARICLIPECEKLIKTGSLIKKIGFEGFVPDCARKIILKACHADPTKRYQSAQEMQQALSKLKFGIDWTFKGYYHWQAEDDGDVYKMDLEPKRNQFVVIYTKNGRRRNEKCKSFTTDAEAIRYMKEIVCKESLV